MKKILLSIWKWFTTYEGLTQDKIVEIENKVYWDSSAIINIKVSNNDGSFHIWDTEQKFTLWHPNDINLLYPLIVIVKPLHMRNIL